MQITETERLMLVKKKEEICGLTLRTIEQADDPKNTTELKKNITMVLSVLSTIGSYSDSKNYKIDGFRLVAEDIFDTLNLSIEDLKKLKEDPIVWKKSYVSPIEVFCNYANAIRFDFNHREGIKIKLPRNLNFGHITNQ